MILGAKLFDSWSLSRLFREVVRAVECGDTLRVGLDTLREAHDFLTRLGVEPVPNPYGSYWFRQQLAKACRDQWPATGQPWVWRMGERGDRYLQDQVIARLGAPLPVAPASWVEFCPNDPASFLEELTTLVIALFPPERRHRENHLHLQVIGPLQDRASLHLGLKELLSETPHLHGIRCHFLSGEELAYLKKDGKIVLASPERPFKKTAEGVLATPWNIPEEPIHELIRQAREVKRLRLKDLVEEINADRRLWKHLRYSFLKGDQATVETLRATERGRPRPLPFPLLMWLANRLGRDVRPWIASSNRTYFPHIPPDLWSTRHFPLYIGGQADLGYLERYLEAAAEGRAYQGRGSFGWLARASRQAPLTYRFLDEQAMALQVSPPRLGELEWNALVCGPSVETLQAYAATSGLALGDWIDVTAQTFHPRLPLPKLFPGQSVFLNPQSEDRAKVSGFVAAMANGTLDGGVAKYAFAVRKLEPEASPVALSLERSRYHNFWGKRELDPPPLRGHELALWGDLFKTSGHEALARLVFPDHGIDRVALEVALGIEGKGPIQLVQEGVIGSSQIVTDLLEGRDRVVTAETLARLHNRFQDFQAGRVYLAQHPALVETFPELQEEEPFGLRLPQQFLKELWGFDLRERLFAFRMGPPNRPELVSDYATAGIVPGVPCSRVKMGKLLGIHTEMVARLEEFEGGSLLHHRRLASLLGVDPRLVYLDTEPLLLKIFPLREEWSDLSLSLSKSEQQSLDKRGRTLVSLRTKLKKALEKKKRKGEEPEETLARVLGIPLEEARRFFAKDIAPFHQSLASAAQQLGISYRDWYECLTWASLVYFLGRDKGGKIDYRLPEGITDWKAIERLTADEIRAIIFQGIRESDLPTREKLQRMKQAREPFNNGRELTDFVLRSLTRGAALDQRLLFLWSRREELRPMMI